MNTPAIVRVIEGGYCIGCGACAAIAPDFRVEPTPRGFIEARSLPGDKDLRARASAICPFGDAPNETVLARELFADAPYSDDAIGRYRGLYAGHSPKLRAVAGSGGGTRWFLAELLRRGAVEFVVSVNAKRAMEEGDLFSYRVFEDPNQYLENASTSAYYPVTLAALIEELRKRDGRFAITALPCFSRALRSLTRIDADLASRLVCISGIICGGLKGRRYAEYLADQMQVPPPDLGAINFRGKSLSRTANEKCVEVWSSGQHDANPTAVARVQDLRGTDYGAGYFKPLACDFCDDVFAETADVSFGDAWMSPYRDDPRGTSLVVVRTAWAQAIIEDGRNRGELIMSELACEDVRASQMSGLRHRRQGLAVRLWLNALMLRWSPRKRVRPRLGSWQFTVSQICRVAVRKLTSSAWFDNRGIWFDRTLRLCERVLNKLRASAGRPQSNELGALLGTMNEH